MTKGQRSNEGLRLLPLLFFHLPAVAQVVTIQRHQSGHHSPAAQGIDRRNTRLLQQENHRAGNHKIVGGRKGQPWPPPVLEQFARFRLKQSVDP